MTTSWREELSPDSTCRNDCTERFTEDQTLRHVFLPLLALKPPRAFEPAECNVPSTPRRLVSYAQTHRRTVQVITLVSV